MDEYQVNRDPQDRLARVRCFALDMDGTLFLGRQWIDGAREFLTRIEETGRSYVFMTNNSSKDTAAHLEKLADMGLCVEADKMVSSGQATVAYLQRHHPGKRVFLLGNPALAREFAAAGIPLDDEAPQVVVTGFDTTLTYAKMDAACRFVRAGLPYVATHPDFNCPTENGPIPDIGAIHAFIEASAGRRPNVIVGKPHRPIMDYLLQRTGTAPGETALVGDRLYTDIAGAVAGGLLPVLVLSGEGRLEDIAAQPEKPALVFDSVKEMIPLL